MRLFKRDEFTSITGFTVLKSQYALPTERWQFKAKILLAFFDDFPIAGFKHTVS